MKKIISVILIVVLMFFITGCVSTTDKQDVLRVVKTPSLHTESDVDNAIDSALKYFKKNFKGCEVTQIEYDEEKHSYDIEYYSSLHETDVIVVKIDFVYKDGEEDFRECILICENGKWIVKDCGYP